MLLDKHSPIPLYYQLAERIRERIESGELKLGDNLPSERELSEQSGISRMTARQAVAYLVRQGVLEVKPGIGTFVAEPKLSHDPLHLLGFTEEMIHRGWQVNSRALEQTLTTPPARVATGLELNSRERVVKIVRLRLSQDTPLLLETIYVPAQLCKGLERQDLVNQSLYDLMEKDYALRLVRSRQTLEAVTANDYEANLFGIEIGTPMLLIEGVTYTDLDRPAEYFKAVYRGDRFKFELESRRNSGTLEPMLIQRASLNLGMV